MGHCHSKKVVSAVNDAGSSSAAVETPSPAPAPVEKSPWMSPFPAGINPSPAVTPGRKLLKWPFPPPSPAKPIMEAIRRRQGRKKVNSDGGSTPEPASGEEDDRKEKEKEKQIRGLKLNKEFGFPKNFGAKYEIEKEVGKGHFGHTCLATGKKAEVKGLSVAVKIISKAKMTSAIAIEDVRREVKILKAFSGQKHMLKFYDAFEDSKNVYIVTELCEGGELLDRILQRGGCYTEKDAKAVLVQILSAVAFCHTQGVVHRDLKPENFLFTTKDEDSPLKIIDFGLSEFVGPDRRLNDVVGSAYYVAPEVLHRSYNVEADMWSIGVITYILLCGSRPFWARTESGVFRSVLRANPDFDNTAWSSISLHAKDFVKRLLNKDPRKRMTAVQALAHPWVRDENQPLPLDILPYKLVRSYIQAPPLKRAALKALSKALTENELFYFREQFRLLEPNNGCVSLENFKVVLTRSTTDAMKQARVTDILAMMEPLNGKNMDFEEFCCAAISVYQLEVLESWDKIATTAFQHFEQEGNRVISVEELAKEMNLDPRAYALVKDWIRSSDGKFNFLGYTKFLHGVTIRSSNTRRE